MRIDFYYWGMQCPIHQEMLDLLDEFSNQFTIKIYNIEDNYSLARKMNMFYPFLTVVDGRYKFFAPIMRGFLEQLVNGVINMEKPYIIPLANKVYKGDIIPLTSENISLLSEKCTMSCSEVNCAKKADFLSKYCDGIYGYANIKEGTLVGGAEYIPSIYVPYDIPRSKEYAFITCIYHSSAEFDYKSYPLGELERYLSSSYSKVYAITDEVGTFPNGNLEWFLQQGYQDEGIIAVEEGYCRLHLVSKKLM
ncbi:MAG TPA: hypothetical protein VHQ24_14700 [Lachnospiraceae bacterium]|nr:hypothetical protein [Lachnospiraceae bacterium]